MKLSLKAIQKTYRTGDSRLNILTGLDVELQTGEVVAILGESGSGKSTLLSCLAGFERPDAGHLLWQGEDTATWDDGRWAHFRRTHLGFVFQHYHLIPYLTAIENVGLPLRLLGRPLKGEAQALLAELGLSERARHLPSQLSGGEAQRVAIGRALIHQPGLLLADEPTGSLDTKTGAMVLDLLFSAIRQRQQSALIVTHSLEVAERCHRRLRLKDGRLWPC